MRIVVTCDYKRIYDCVANAAIGIDINKVTIDKLRKKWNKLVQERLDLKAQLEGK